MASSMLACPSYIWPLSRMLPTITHRASCAFARQAQRTKHVQTIRLLRTTVHQPRCFHSSSVRDYTSARQPTKQDREEFFCARVLATTRSIPQLHSLVTSEVTRGTRSFQKLRASSSHAWTPLRSFDESLSARLDAALSLAPPEPRDEEQYGPADERAFHAWMTELHARVTSSTEEIQGVLRGALRHGRARSSVSPELQGNFNALLNIGYYTRFSLDASLGHFERLVEEKQDVGTAAAATPTSSACTETQQQDTQENASARNNIIHPRLEWTDLVELLDLTVDQVRDVSFRKNSGCPTVQVLRPAADEPALPAQLMVVDYVHYAFFELLKNAVSACIKRYGSLDVDEVSPPITCTVSHTPPPDGGNAEPGDVRVVISDEGCGMSPTELSQALDYSSSNWQDAREAEQSTGYGYSKAFGSAFSGHGVGLPRSVLALRFHEATVRLTSAGLDQGSTVTVVFPYRKLDVAVVSPPASQ